ncbi:MAG: bifunctional folylpolyglutamate synthase/dihydrofolate synthase [Firmicutes bacterium]|nr:bifunctional folylpolyglutamate synthase/dihydrofolate synthase [Bacillota bacterium]
MNYQQAIEFLEISNWMGSRLGLSRVKELLHRAGDPQNKMQFIHVAGTNGKGSTAAMLASVLQEAGYRTGLYTSPHLRRYNERIRIDGEDVSDEEMCRAAEILEQCVAQMDDRPTVFERITALAMVCFERAGCDVVVLEVGMGGRLDATNVIERPACSVLCHIDLDHTEILGDTIAKIAEEKAGIVKQGCPAVAQKQSGEALNVFRKTCEELDSPLTVTEPDLLTVKAQTLDGQLFDYRSRKDLQIPLIANYQLANVMGVLDTVDVLQQSGWHISEDALREGLKKTRWAGRFEILGRDPLMIIDGAHNPDGAQQLAECLATYLPDKKITFLMGVMADKDYRQMIRTIAPFAKEFVTVTPDSSRSLPCEELARVIEEETGLPAAPGGDVKSGFALARQGLAEDDVLCIFGSLYQVGDVQEALDGV